MIKNTTIKVSYIEIKLLTAKKGEFKLNGKFNIHYLNDGMLIKGSDVLKHIVLVVTEAGSYEAVQPFKKIITFSDDVNETQEGCSGSFNINLLDDASFNRSGDYYILCSLGTVISNVVLANVIKKNNEITVQAVDLPEPEVFPDSVPYDPADDPFRKK